MYKQYSQQLDKNQIHNGRGHLENAHASQIAATMGWKYFKFASLILCTCIVKNIDETTVFIPKGSPRICPLN